MQGIASASQWVPALVLGAGGLQAAKPPAARLNTQCVFQLKEGENTQSLPEFLAAPYNKM